MDEEQQGTNRDPERNARIVEMRDGGASWLELQQAFGLTRQQVRYGYQLGKRTERRAAKRTGD